MVLDISGSMGSNSKIDNLRDAAKVFVDTVVRDETHDLISVSIVPYSAHVNAGRDDIRRMNVNAPFTTIRIAWNSRTRTSAADVLYADRQPLRAKCSTSMELRSGLEPDERIQFARATTMKRSNPSARMPHALKSQIDQLEPRANTSIFLGMKWGTALLDPSFALHQSEHGKRRPD